MRESLMEAIDAVKAGRLDPQAATAIAKLAAQISLSMQVEANIRVNALTGPKPEFGEMPIGNGQTLIENEPSQPTAALPGFQQPRTVGAWPESATTVHRLRD